MKKFLIFSYFMGALLLTYYSAKAVAVYTSPQTEVDFREHERTLSDSEIAEKSIQPQEGKKVVLKWKTKETRTKTLLGWETVIDTTEAPSTYYVDCGCK